ncbi:GntR family transcriptional regulator [Actinomadura rugatobispora]|uniref:GntR family transcriptional regulator n=1 Tax=Actinomadura rugatobispora TaxID=1994 RepID=A0ABW0ZXS1_9ACTN|nr:GntR family transcriptional regulator [Actinomadura rugatobispora]
MARAQVGKSPGEGALADILAISANETDPDHHLQIKEVVYRRLVRAIVELHLRPGQQLRERQLAEQMRVSKTPIREALVRLEKEGLVTVAPYRGAIVRGYTHTDVREIYELRELLEGFCARRAAMQISDADEAELRANVRRSRELLDAGASDELPALFDEFDRILYRQAAGHRIGGLLVELDLHLERLGNLTVEVPGRLDASVRQHEAIVHAIIKRDPPAAESACRDHIRSVYADLISELPEGW